MIFCFTLKDLYIKIKLYKKGCKMLKKSSLDIIASEFNSEESKFMEQKCIEFRDRIKEIVLGDTKGDPEVEMLIDLSLHKLRKEIIDMKECDVKDNMLKIFKVLNAVVKNELLV